jgi:hypothetical protein
MKEMVHRTYIFLWSLVSLVDMGTWSFKRISVLWLWPLTRSPITYIWRQIQIIANNAYKTNDSTRVLPRILNLNSFSVFWFIRCKDRSRSDKTLWYFAKSTNSLCTPKHFDLTRSKPEEKQTLHYVPSENILLCSCIILH